MCVCSGAGCITVRYISNQLQKNERGRAGGGGGWEEKETRRKP